MIETLHLDKFKPFQNQTINFSKINVLTGGNNTGKSSVIEALLMIQRSPYILENIKGNCGSVLSWKESIPKRAIDGEVKLSVKLTDNLTYSLNSHHYDLSLQYNSNRIFKTALLSKNPNRFGFFCRFAPFCLATNDGKYPQMAIKWLKFIIPEFSEENQNHLDFSLLRDTPYELSPGGMYVAWLLSVIFELKKNSLIIIENPEANLHPFGQIRLTEFLVYMANKGHQIILETHSDHIINGFRLAVKNLHILPDEIRFTHFSKVNKSGWILIEPLKLDDNGRFDYYPKRFMDTWDNTLERLL